VIAVLGGVSIYRMSTDIFPELDIPVVSVVWQYFGMPADEIETRIILINERVLTASVNDIRPAAGRGPILFHGGHWVARFGAHSKSPHHPHRSVRLARSSLSSVATHLRFPWHGSCHTPLRHRCL